MGTCFDHGRTLQSWGYTMTTEGTLYGHGRGHHEQAKPLSLSPRRQDTLSGSTTGTLLTSSYLGPAIASGANSDHCVWT